MAWVDVTVLGLVGGAPGGERMASFVDSAVTLGRADDPPLLDTVHLRRPSIEMVGIGALVSTHRNCFIILDFAGVPASRAYRAAGGGEGKKTEALRAKKTKKNTPSGTRIRRICLEGRSVTLTPMASFFRAQHRWVRSDESWERLFFCDR